MGKPNIKIYKDHPSAIIPSKRQGDAGYDLAALSYHSIGCGERVLVDTGIVIQSEDNIYGRICPRSGKSLQLGLDVMAGIIDTKNYLGSIGVLLINLGQKPIEIQPGEKIAQIIFQKYYDVLFEEVMDKNQFIQTERGNQGYGSTGK